MEKSVLDLTDIMRHQKQGSTTSESIDLQGIFVVKLRAQKTKSHFFNTQLPLNEDGNNLDKQLSFSNYKVTVRKFHDYGWKNSSHKSADIAMLGYGYGVSMYPQFFDKDSKTFQMLPRPYIRSFDGQCSDQVLKKNACWTWQIEQKHLYWKVLSQG